MTPIITFQGAVQQAQESSQVDMARYSLHSPLQPRKFSMNDDQYSGG